MLVEHYVSRESNVSMAGNIYLGRVQNVLPSMEAAFVDIGKGRNAVLYAGEVNWDAAGPRGNQAKRIENALKSGDRVLVQVTKDPIGHKGARLTSQISLPGRYLVYVPEGSMTGISRKLPDTERARLKKILKEVVPDERRRHRAHRGRGRQRGGAARATSSGSPPPWEEIKAKADVQPGQGARPCCTASPTSPSGSSATSSTRTSPAWSSRATRPGRRGQRATSAHVAPDLAERVYPVDRRGGPLHPLPDGRADRQGAWTARSGCPRGGSLVIDRTEAMTVVDVNTGKFVGSGGNLEETVTKNNIEAAEEIVRQLRLRDIGGIIVIDFIDMVLESNRDLVRAPPARVPGPGPDQAPGGRGDLARAWSR